MHEQPNESDWKAFRRMVPELRERYLQKVNQELTGILNVEGATPTELFWDLEKRMQKEVRILRACLDGHRRSRMTSFLLLMYRHGMIRDEDLSPFSEELRSRLDQLKEL